MQKYCLALALLSFPMIAMYSEISIADKQTSCPGNELTAKPQQVTIVKLILSSGGHWHEIEALLSNGDTLTYTKFPYLNNTSACIHAIPLDSAHEMRNNASDYWHKQMERIYLEKTKRSIVNL